MKRYYQTTQSKIFGLLSGAIMLVLLGLVILYFLPFLLQEVLVFGLIGFILLILGLLTAHLTISANGIEYSLPFRIFEVGWEGFDRIDKRRFSEGLIVRSGYQVPLKNSLPANIKAYGGIYPYDFIPLSLFANCWRDSELGQLIKQYTPHLFEKENL